MESIEITEPINTLDAIRTLSIREFRNDTNPTSFATQPRLIPLIVPLDAIMELMAISNLSTIALESCTNKEMIITAKAIVNAYRTI